MTSTEAIFHRRRSSSAVTLGCGVYCLPRLLSASTWLTSRQWMLLGRSSRMVRVPAPVTVPNAEYCTGRSPNNFSVALFRLLRDSYVLHRSTRNQSESRLGRSARWCVQVLIALHSLQKPFIKTHLNILSCEVDVTVLIIFGCCQHA